MADIVERLNDLKTRGPEQSVCVAWIHTILSEAAAEIKALRLIIRENARTSALRSSGERAAVESAAARDVLAERRRQVEVEGWAPEHDDEHEGGQMALAAAAYAVASLDGNSGWARSFWPWAFRWWKPKERRRDLVRAGALILAEIERLDRRSPPPSERGEGT